MDQTACLVFIFLCDIFLYLIILGVGSLSMLGFSVPSQLILGQSATLECNFDLEGSKLYSVKWYKNGQEFYRFMPAMDRQYDVFDVKGVNIDVSYSFSWLTLI